MQNNNIMTMNKFVAIITQPLMTNYGCLLQNWAMQQAVNKLGYQSITFDQSEWYPPLGIRLKIAVKQLLNLSTPNVFEQFITQNINRTSKAYFMSDFVAFDKKYHPHAYIVGSDQVWRPRYNRLLDASFLIFTTNSRKIAYAASFGTDKWEFNEQQTAAYSKAIRQFRAIGVREQSAITLCKDYWDVDVTLVLDPTLLLTAEEYFPLLNKSNKQNHVFTYILDSESWKRVAVKSICIQKQICELAGMYDMDGQIHERISVGEWLTYLSQSKFVVCDSFHGTVFSILMHRPFLVLGNSKRGNTRLLSILKAVGLENRLIQENDSIDMAHLPDLNWRAVDLRLSKLRSNSMEFLLKALA